MSHQSHLIAYQNIPEPLLTFNPERDDCTSMHPLKGLIEYGPYNQKLIGNAFPTIRVATIGPRGTQKVISELINKLKSKQTPQERKEYLIDFPGFKNVFKKDIEINTEINIEISQEQEALILNADKPYKKLVDLFMQLIPKIANNKYDFDISEESLGTQVIFSFIPVIKDVIDNGKVLLIDEFDKSLHPYIVKYIVELFNDTDLNKNNAQLIFNTHDTNLLDLELLRRDQIWFTEKNPENGESTLYALDDFSIRKSENVEKGYLLGRYGAVPFLVNNFDDFKE